jgi:hypothetical protein
MPFLIPNALTRAECIVDVGVLAFAIIVSSACSSQQTVRTLADLFVIYMGHKLLILRMSVVNSTNMMKAISIRFPYILFRHANVNKVLIRLRPTIRRYNSEFPCTTGSM